jgi:hypothetical protein
MTQQDLTVRHNLISTTIFRLKTVALTVNRFFKNLSAPVRKFKNDGQLIYEPVIAFSESDLWNLHDNKENWILTAGKIENLRIAARKLNGLEIKTNEVFSFWRHIGNPNYAQGYVVGREIREGCIMPTIGGGLCQISNALYDAALNANFDIIERHKHTKVIKGSLAEQDRDATVKWNYLDLRFKSSYDYRIEVELSSDKLIVIFKSKQKNTKSLDYNFNVRQSNKLNDCYSCGNFACFKHPDRSSVKQEIATTTFILDEKWPELDNYVKSIATSADYFVTPLKRNSFIKTDRYSWTAMNTGVIRTTTLQGIYRALRLRYSSRNKNNIFELSLNLDKKIARAAARQIPIASSHVIISQNLLPFIYETGALGGRTYDVLMTRLPIENLHERLDFAYSRHPESSTLNDFRASAHLIEIENKALTKARKIITTHSEIAEIFNNKVVKLSWQTPPINNVKLSGTKVLFPASAVGRKGAYEIRRVAKELNLQLVVAGATIEKDNFWEGMKVEKFAGNFDQIGLIVYPTFIEYQPRQILKAISKGIPVITTKACGLDRSDQVKIVEMNNVEHLKSEVLQLWNFERFKTIN